MGYRVQPCKIDAGCLAFASEAGAVSILEKLFPLVVDEEKFYRPLVYATAYKQEKAMRFLIPLSDLILTEKKIFRLHPTLFDIDECVLRLRKVQQHMKSEEEWSVLQKSALSSKNALIVRPKSRRL